jgi:hypothetical protein
MKRRDFLKTAAGLFIPVAPAIIRPASAQMWPFPGPGRAAVGGGGGYTGPGDVVSGASAWWGLRAYNAAYATGSNPAVDLVDQSANNPITININSSGNLDQAAINSWVTANSVTTIFCVKVYDQTGNGRHMTASFATSPRLVVGAVGSYSSTLQFGNGGAKKLIATGFAVSQPFSCVASVVFTSHSGIAALMTDSTGAQFLINTTPALRVQANTALNNATTLSDNTWYAVQGVFNGASSSATVNASTTSGNAGTNGIVNTHHLSTGNDDFSEALTGSLGEWGVWPSNISGSSPISNMRTYGGF